MKRIFILALISLMTSFCGISQQNDTPKESSGDSVNSENRIMGSSGESDKETRKPDTNTPDNSETSDTVAVVEEAIEVYERVVSDAESRAGEFVKEVEEASEQLGQNIDKLRSVEKHMVDTIASLNKIIEDGRAVQTRTEEAISKISILDGSEDGDEETSVSDIDPDLDRVNKAILSTAKGERKNFAMQVAEAVHKFAQRITETERIVANMEYTLAELRNILEEAEIAQEYVQRTIGQQS